MNRTALLTALLSCAAAPLRADAIALELSRSPFCLLGETIRVSVARGMALVEGRYEFKYVPRFDGGPHSDRVAFEFPVFAPAGAESLTALIETLQPKLRVGAAEFTPSGADPWSEATGGSLPFVPESVRVAILVFEVPRVLLRERCTLDLTYYQPTHRLADKEVVAYLPLLPDFEALKNELLFSRLDFTVEFEAVDRIRLHRLSANESVVRDTPEKVTVHPVHREIIALTIEAAAPAAEGPRARP